MSRSPNTLPAAILGLAIVSASLVGAVAVERVRRGGDEITVTGSATRAVTSDLAVWRLDVVAQDRDQLAATRASAAGATATRAWLVAAGLPDSAITTRAPTTFTQEEWVNGSPTGRIVGHRVSTQVEVRTPAVDLVATLAADPAALLDLGVPVVPQSPEYLYADLPAIRGPLLAEATLDARGRAEEIVGAAGARVGRIKAVRVGVFQVRKRQSTEISDYGMYDTADREKDITGVIRVTFAID
ncbi:MAG: SIMPL domain-containing protein [Gemmatimonadetes bacterium]|nr:SIMPL domain-containing protein [Gemmatimonadota bacterium]MCB9505163.1 SIMPL domain-containing protein [Gemmatimonadales bacterium]MCA9762166.1 SIMPL domain-containing protein [Gemmatimonadota bacterium]MCB9518663.1 SIMPL domain-containing protein [Gemmatimonadales bacterium]HPF61474.1 SIMPL domain-containing protein [Gemmatimonadales bacterium]